MESKRMRLLSQLRDSSTDETFFIIKSNKSQAKIESIVGAVVQEVLGLNPGVVDFSVEKKGGEITIGFFKRYAQDLDKWKELKIRIQELAR